MAFRKSEPYIVPLIIVLVGLCAFGLGRLSGVGEGGPRLIINVPESASAAAVGFSSTQPAAEESGKGIVASKSGSKYYLSTCSGASRIKPENKVWFENVAEARAAGYEPAANCEGL